MRRDIQNMKSKIINHRSVPTATKSRCDTIITSAGKHNFHKINKMRFSTSPSALKKFEVEIELGVDADQPYL